MPDGARGHSRAPALLLPTPAPTASAPPPGRIAPLILGALVIWVFSLHARLSILHVGVIISP